MLWIVSAAVLVIAIVLAVLRFSPSSGAARARNLNLRTVTRQELTAAGAMNESGVHYLSIVGHVFDVSSGRAYYGKDGSYAFFAGTDGTRAFATGDFTPAGLQESFEGLPPASCTAIVKWLQFFQNHKRYWQLGFLEDSVYFDKSHTPTEAYFRLQECAGVGQKESESATSRGMCSSHWDLRAGMRTVWCEDSADGGREGKGENENESESENARVPRRASFMSSDNTLREQCICIPLEQLSERYDVQEYSDCDPRSKRCVFEQKA
jgi:hypothetical protein